MFAKLRSCYDKVTYSMLANTTIDPGTARMTIATVVMAVATVVLVIVNIFYAVLVWKSLREAQRASLREREARHLQEIKDNVAQPILLWIEGTIGHRFTGGTPEILSAEGGIDAIPRQVSHTVDDPFTARRRLSVLTDPQAPDPLATWDSTDTGRISTFLYNHAKRDHFPEELGAFDSFLEEVRYLTADLVSFANECSKCIATPEIPYAARFADENSMSEFGSPWQLVVECVRSLMHRETRPYFFEQHAPPFHTFYGTQTRVIAKGTDLDKIKRWLDSGAGEIHNRWKASDLPKRVENLLSTAERVRQNMQHILFTHSLDVDCELVSGKKSGRKRSFISYFC